VLFRSASRANSHENESIEFGDVGAHLVFPVGPVVAALGTPVVYRVADVFGVEYFGEAIGGAALLPLARAGDEVDVAGS
jgi:hypothetical protein